MIGRKHCHLTWTDSNCRLSVRPPHTACIPASLAASSPIATTHGGGGEGDRCHAARSKVLSPCPPANSLAARSAQRAPSARSQQHGTVRHGALPVGLIYRSLCSGLIDHFINFTQLRAGRELTASRRGGHSNQHKTRTLSIRLSHSLSLSRARIFIVMTGK